MLYGDKIMETALSCLELRERERERERDVERNNNKQSFDTFSRSQHSRFTNLSVRFGC